MPSIAEIEKAKIVKLLRSRRFGYSELASEVGCNVSAVKELARELLLQRAVLTRAVCREVGECSDAVFARARAALQLLEEWLERNEGYSIPSYCLEEVDETLPEWRSLIEEIQDGHRICSALSLVGMADSNREALEDWNSLQSALAEYRGKHGVPVCPG